MAKRGIILRDVKDGSGLLAVDGKQYSFLLESMWHSQVTPKVGMPVDVTFNSDGAPESIRPVSATQPTMHSMHVSRAGVECMDAPKSDSSNPERKLR
jgi:hypothetical protein